MQTQSHYQKHYIIKKLQSTKIKILNRNKKLSTDKANIKDVMLDVIEKFQMKQNDIIIMLYLTSPKRKITDIKKILKFYKKKKTKSLTCCVEVKSNPYLCFFKLKDHKGKQIVKHDLYRRQDYPQCFEMRHFVVIFDVNEIKKLNKNLYNEKTTFYEIDNDDIDVDYEEDLKKLNN